MVNYKVGDYIRLIRNANDMTQEELAFRAGVATETISRIENGKHKITKNVYRKIMSVFDYFPQQFYGICTDNDIEIMDIKQAEEDAEVKFEYEAAREYLEILRQKAGDTLVNRQYILRAEAVLDCRIGKIDVQEMLEKLIDALKLTLNNYESILNTGKIYPFTEIEASILMNISDAYGIIEEYECDEFMDGISVADKLGYDHALVYKTLVTVGKSGGHYVFVIPIEAEIDFKKAAKVVGEKSLEMLPLKDLTKVTGYVRGGCTAVGMKKQFPTVIQKDAEVLEYMHVSAGKLGMQLKLIPSDLQKASNAKFGDVIH